MNDVYIASKYRKFVINDNLYVYVRIGLIKNATINPNSDFKRLTYKDGKNIKRTLNCLKDDCVMASDDRYVYDCPINLSKYKKYHPELTEEEIISKYMSKISQVINFAVYDEEYERFKVLVTNEQKLANIQDDSLFNNISIYYDSLDEVLLSLPVSDLVRMKELLKNEDYDTLNNKLSNLIKDVNSLEKANDEKPMFRPLDNNEVCDQKTEKAFFALDSKKKKEDTIDEPIKELNNLIGLDNVKEELNELILFLDYMNKVSGKANLPRPNLHMFFSGNPGTGKTTVARIMSRALYNIGYTANNNFVEITPKDLVAGYVGQTATKTDKIIKENQGGVIFIDEAYVLASSGNKFANEALVEILKALEKNDTVFIFAGYKDEMQEFMNLNPGLSSRIGYYLEYEDYDVESLYKIFETKVLNMNLKIDENLKEKLISHLEEAKGNEHFGNGRYIDKLIQKMLLKHALNTKDEDDINKLLTLTLHDFTDDLDKSLVYKKNVKKIGF